MCAWFSKIKKKDKKCCSACNLVREVKRIECLCRTKREREWNVCASQKEKEKWSEIVLDYPKKVLGGMNA
jgi:hypothetical protein